MDGHRLGDRIQRSDSGHGTWTESPSWSMEKFVGSVKLWLYEIDGHLSYLD